MGELEYAKFAYLQTFLTCMRPVIQKYTTDLQTCMYCIKQDGIFHQSANGSCRDPQSFVRAEGVHFFEVFCLLF